MTTHSARRRCRSILSLLLVHTSVCWAAETPPVTLEQVVALTESVGYQLDVEEHERYGLFPDREGFLLAEFTLRDGTYWLRVSYRHGIQRWVEQSRLTDSQFLTWRKKVLAIDRGAAASVSGRTLSAADGRDGRSRMVTDVFLYGLWLYGPATIALFEVDSSRGAAAIELLAGGGAFAGALTMTQDYRLGYARTKIVRWGNYIGTFYGSGIPVLLDADNQRIYALSAMAATPIGGYLAHRWTEQRHFSKGQADLITAGSLVGAYYGLALPFLLGADEDAGPRLYLASSMAGAPIGALLTASLMQNRRIDRGRAHLMMLGGVMGAVQGAGFVDVIHPDAPPRVYGWAAALGAPAGAWLGYQKTQGRRQTLGRARMISVGSYAGALVGQGISTTLALEGRARTVSGMMGSMLGLWYTDRRTQDWGEDLYSSTASESPHVEWSSPAALLTLVNVT
ncbi:MAG: hypothetical protein HOH74_09275, partial [Gemmatimonadetes bacterium]|nr:hypothetical protein [Gemmatimonadota bacterium]